MTKKHPKSKSKTIIALILFLVVVLRLPSLFEPNCYADEDIYLTLGQGLRKGLVFYRDIHDNKPPLLYIFAAIAGNVPIFRLILLFWNLINVYLIWLISQKFFKKSWPGLASTFLFALFSSIPLTEGNMANGEIFMIMPTTAALLLLLTSSKFFLTGLFFSLAFLFKVPVIFEFFVIVFWLAFYQQKTLLGGIKKIFSAPVLLLTAGFSLPIVATIAGYYSVGAGPSYVKAALLQNVGYLSSWEGSTRPIYQSQFFIRTIILVVLVLSFYLLRHRLGKKFGLIALWFSAALFGALLSGRPYPHYLIQILPPAVFLLVWPFTQKAKKPYFFSSAILIILTTFSLYYYKFWHYPTISYYQNFIQYQLGKIDKETYYRFWGETTVTNHQIANYIKDNTRPDQKIFVWGTQPAIYAISDRLPVGKYTVAYHVVDFRAHHQTMDSLISQPPPFIIYFPQAPSFPRLDQFINLNYSVDRLFSSAIIFRLNQ